MIVKDLTETEPKHRVETLGVEEIADMLDRATAAGWRLVSIVPSPTGAATCILKKKTDGSPTRNT
jgi:hypothetical protein